MARTDQRFLHVSVIVYLLLMNNERRGRDGVIVPVTYTYQHTTNQYISPLMLTCLESHSCRGVLDTDLC